MTTENNNTREIDVVELQRSLEEILFSYQALFNILELSQQPLIVDFLVLLKPLNDKLALVVDCFD